MKDLLQEIKNFKTSTLIQSMRPLPGDASTRKYFRITLHNKKSFVLMKTDSFEEKKSDLPFLVVQNHLETAGVVVPKVYDYDPKQGFILLEDLGDTTLLKKLQSISHTEQERHLYEKAIDALVDLQVFASPANKPAVIEPYKLRFDVEKLMWEVHFTIEHFYKYYLKKEIKGGDLKTMLSGFSEISEILEAQPVVLTHRDYHSRNIMVVPHRKKIERLVLIDFQDARLGPKHYDLASLLRDSYYQLDDIQVDRLIDYYIAKWEAKMGDKMNRKEFRRIFDLMAVQRSFKAIGSFASFYHLRGNPLYLKYIGTSFENIRRSLQKYAKYHPLKEVLFHYYNF